MQVVNKRYVILAFTIAIATYFTTDAFSLYLTADEGPASLLLLIPSAILIAIAIRITKKCKNTPNEITSKRILETSLTICTIIAIGVFTVSMAMAMTDIYKNPILKEISNQLGTTDIDLFLIGDKNTPGTPEMKAKREEEERKQYGQKIQNEWKTGIAIAAKIGLSLSIAWTTILHTTKNLPYKSKSIPITLANMTLTFTTLWKCMFIILIISIAYGFLVQTVLPTPEKT